MSQSCPICKDCANKLDNLVSKNEAIYNRLFVDNGKPCVQTMLDRHETAIGVLRWLLGTLGAACIAAAVAMVIK